MQFVEALGLLKADDLRFLHAINALRNTVVHDVRKVGFDLNAHVAGLDKGQLQGLAPAESEIDVPGEGKQSIAALFKSNPKRSTWWSSMTTVGIICENKKMIALRNEMRSSANAYAALMGLRQIAIHH